MAPKKRRKTPTKTRLKKAGLAAPVTSKDKSNFAAIQKKWYDKLAAEGFEDLEWVDHSTGIGQNSDFLKGSLIGGKQYHAGRALYYQLASNYLIHCQDLKGSDKFLWEHHAAGKTYAEIAKLYRAKYKKRISVYTVYYRLQDIAKLCYIWNTSQEEGLLRKRQEDRQAIEGSAAAEFTLEEYNWIINREFAAQIADNKGRK